jgi:hypothetical protein
MSIDAVWTSRIFTFPSIDSALGAARNTCERSKLHPAAAVPRNRLRDHACLILILLQPIQVN